MKILINKNIIKIYEINKRLESISQKLKILFIFYTKLLLDIDESKTKKIDNLNSVLRKRVILTTIKTLSNITKICQFNKKKTNFLCTFCCRLSLSYFAIRKKIFYF